MIESRLFRTLLGPLAVVILFLLITPKLCSHAIVQIVNNRRRIASSPVPVARSGLVIDSAAPAAVPSPPPAVFPDGLDAGRIEYLIEIDQSFAAPATMAVTASAPITPELVRLQYVARNPDGSYLPTRDGFMNVNGATETADGWIVPVAQRKFIGVRKIENGDDGFDISAVWQWQPTAIGAALLQNPKDHVMTAEFMGGAGHWVLARWIQPPDGDLK